MITFNSILTRLMTEGGAAGHMAHPFDFAKTGAQLVDIFNKSIRSLKRNVGSVKIDGINASIRLVNGQFVMDRGSAKPFDIKGMRPGDLLDRFGPGHGFIEIGSKVIKIFDEAIPTTKIELKKLGLVDNPNILLNIEYVMGTANVLGYKDIGNFLAIHGLQEIKPRTFDKSGNVKSRDSAEIPYDKLTMKSYIEKLNAVSNKYGFKILGSIDTSFKSEPNINKVMSEFITLYPNGVPIKKTLKQWLVSVTIYTPLITREQFIKALNSKNISADFPGENVDKITNDTVVYLTTIKLGDEILKNMTSEIGDLTKHEGIVVRDNEIYNKPFKITGGFIIKGLESKFKK